jgi:FMN phosphatase YigB (HAD superfamily)/sugar phosphate isomerase/epimerase
MLDAILFDVGGTLKRSTRNTEAQRRESLPALNALLGTHLTAEEWDERLLPRAREYKLWAEEAGAEIPEEDFWTRWMLPEFPAELVRPRALELHRAWRRAQSTWEMLPHADRVVKELFRRGYRLGVISNASSRTEAPEFLERHGILECFDVLVLSGVYGKRKPDLLPFELATTSMEIRPERCAFVGNRRDTDLAGARKAGFAKVVLLRRLKPNAKDLQASDLVPDHWIDDLEELLEIFPPRFLATPLTVGRPGASSPARWKASLSTMGWNRQSARLDEFVQSALATGFSGVELNHDVDSAALADSTLHAHVCSSVHEPCPRDVPAARVVALDWQLSSEDEARRRQAVRMVKRSIHLARELGAAQVVVHPGSVPGDAGLEKELRRLFQTGRAGTPEYAQLRDRMIEIRRLRSGPRLEAVQRSLSELLACARDEGILLGLENRYHYLDIPTPDEMERLLACAGPDVLGMVYDVGHAQAMERLGFFTHREWLERFADRIVEVHLHDVKGVDDHLAPGLGEVDFARLAPWLPAGALRTCEIRPQATPEQIVAGMQTLVRLGCVEAC